MIRAARSADDFARCAEISNVRGSHRRRGIATALKRAQASWAAANGYTELVTSTVEGNDAMRRVNARLGYRPLPARIVVQGSAG